MDLKWTWLAGTGHDYFLVHLSGRRVLWALAALAAGGGQLVTPVLSAWLAVRWSRRRDRGA